MWTGGGGGGGGVVGEMSVPHSQRNVPARDLLISHIKYFISISVGFCVAIEITSTVQPAMVANDQIKVEFRDYSEALRSFEIAVITKWSMQQH